MKKFRNLVIGGIENKVFNLILFTVLLITIVFQISFWFQNRMLSQISEETNRQQQVAITEATSGLMDTVINKSLDRTAGLEAMIADELFHSLGTRVELLEEYASKILDEPDDVAQMPYSAPDPARNGEITAQLILSDELIAAVSEGVPEESAGSSAYERSGMYIDNLDEALAHKIGAAANMSDMMVSLFGVSEVTNSCFIAFPEGAFLVVDDRSATKYDEKGEPVSYDPRTRPWYIQAVEQGGLIFTDVEIDAFTGDIGIVCAMPVYVNGELAAVVGSDLFLTSMQEAVQASDEDGGFVFIVNQYGHVVFSPMTSGEFKVSDSNDAADLRKSNNQELAALVSDAMQGKTDVHIIDTQEGRCYMNGVPMKTVGWTLFSVFREDVAKQPAKTMVENYQAIQEEAAVSYLAKMRTSRWILMVIMLIVTALALAGALTLGKRIVGPINLITRQISSLSETKPVFEMEDAYRTDDEIEVLAESFASLSQKTVEYVDEVRRVTAEKERFSTELQMATQIQEGMLPSIFPAFPDRREFDIYGTMNPAREVGGDFYDFFLIDEDHLAMVVADVSGKGVPAALFMMASKIILANFATMGLSPAKVLEATNSAVCSSNPQEMFVTVWLGILEISTGKLVASNAGHEYPAIKKGDHFELLKDKHGFVIGGFDGIKYTEYTLQLEPGDKVFLYTDGVPEATNKDLELFGTDRMIEALNVHPELSPRGILGSVHRAVDIFVASSEQFDDLTMLCLEYRGPVKK